MLLVKLNKSWWHFTWNLRQFFLDEIRGRSGHIMQWKLCSCSLSFFEILVQIKTMPCLEKGTASKACREHGRMLHCFFVTCVHKDNNEHEMTMKIAGATWLLTFFCEGKLYGNIDSRMIIYLKQLSVLKLLIIVIWEIHSWELTSIKNMSFNFNTLTFTRSDESVSFNNFWATCHVQ